MKKLFSRILLILIVPLTIIGVVNYFVDPDYTLKKDYIPGIVNALEEGKMACGPVNTNLREIKKQRIFGMKSQPEILVLGSSRTLNLSSEAFPDRRFFNASVSNCTFQDMYAMLEWFDKKNGKLPDEIIICCDLWLFGNTFAEKRWLENRSAFLGMAQKTGGIPLAKIPSKWEIQKEWLTELFSVRYFIRSVTLAEKAEKFSFCDTVDTSKTMLLPDGTRRNSETITNIPEKQKALLAREYFYNSGDEFFQKTDPFQKMLFENLIVYLKNRGCRVTLFIPPYHPETFRLLKDSKRAEGIFMAEKNVRQFAQTHQIAVTGSSNPAKLGFDASQFYDAVHLKKDVLSLIFKDRQK